MKKLMIVFLFAFMVNFGLKAQEIVESYIEAFQYIAVSEMERTGIPASIKLAQGLLESNWGRSELSTFAHNHFGIKCGSSWEGKGYYKVDDDLDENGKLRESCFRVFESDEASYIAHSEFLLSNKRYDFLFDYGSTDYKAWAKGLRKAGYATDPKYPSKLIGIIQKYQLSKFDYMASDELELFASAEQIQDSEDMAQAESDFMEEALAIEEIEEEEHNSSKEEDLLAEASDKKDFTKNYVKYKRAWERAVKETVEVMKEDSKKSNNKGFNFDKLLAEVTEIGAAVLQKEEKEGPTSFPDLESHNGVKMTMANGGETLQDVSARTGISVNDLYVYNDKLYKIKQELLAHSIIYLAPKKSSFSGSRETHEVRHGEKIIEISQRYGVTEKSLRKRNYLKDGEELKHGEIVYLSGLRIGRKPKLRKANGKKSDRISFADDE